MCWLLMYNIVTKKSDQIRLECDLIRFTKVKSVTKKSDHVFADHKCLISLQINVIGSHSTKKGCKCLILLQINVITFSPPYGGGRSSHAEAVMMSYPLVRRDGMYRV